MVKILFITLFLPLLVYSQTTISSGNVSGTWTKAGSPYKIIDEIIWTTKDSINSYTIVISNDKNIINGFFYGIFVNFKDTLYYKVTCEDFIISDSCISFNRNK